MSKHGRYEPSFQHSRESIVDPRFETERRRGDNSPPLKIRSPLLWIGAIFGVAAWSLISLLIYTLADPLLAWLGTAAGVVLGSGKELATAAGADKQITSLVDNFGTSGLLAQALSLLGIVLKPLIVGVWALVAMLILLAPLMAGRISRLITMLRRSAH